MGGLFQSGNLSVDEFGDIVRLHQAFVVVGILLRKEEWLGGFSVGIDVGDVEACEESIVTARGEQHPATGLTPRVEALGVG